MDEFIKQYKQINIKSVKCFLESLSKPCYESELLKIAFPEINISNARPLILYQKHFILFHLLYFLQDEYYKKEKYLYVHFMRIFLADYPRQGLCRFYNEHSGLFCQAKCSFGTTCNNYCDFHQNLTGEHALEELSDKYFYLDKNNFYNLDENTASEFINGTWEIMSQYKDYEKSIKIMGLSGTPDLVSIKRKFRELAKRYHPDLSKNNLNKTGSGSDDQSNQRFYEINRAYRLLTKLVIQPKMQGQD